MVEVSVEVQNRQTCLLGSGRDEQVGDLAAPLASPREKSLNLASAPEMTRVGLDQLERAQCLLE